MIGQEPYANRVGLQIPLFGRTSGLLMCPDIAAVEEDHAQPHALLLHQAQQTFPDTMPAPANEALCRHPPGAVLGRDSAPLGAVLATPDDRFHRLPQVAMLRLVVRAASLDQRLQHHLLRVRQHHFASPSPLFP